MDASRAPVVVVIAAKGDERDVALLHAFATLALQLVDLVGLAGEHRHVCT
jgi:hypothetical protein